MGKCYWNSSADRLAQHRVATDPQFVKKKKKNKTNKNPPKPNAQFFQEQFLEVGFQSPKVFTG